MVQPIVLGIQEHVMSISKHYIMNSQEFDRHSVNEVLDEVTAMELYGPPFGAAAAAGTSGAPSPTPPLLPWQGRERVSAVRSADAWARDACLVRGALRRARSDSAPLRPGRGRLHVRVQPGERRVRLREQGHAEDDAEGLLQLLGLRGL